MRGGGNHALVPRIGYIPLFTLEFQLGARMKQVFKFSKIKHICLKYIENKTMKRLNIITRGRRLLDLVHSKNIQDGNSEIPSKNNNISSLDEIDLNSFHDSSLRNIPNMFIFVLCYIVNSLY